MRLLRIGERQATLIQALLMGMAGACAALLFEWGSAAVQGLCTGDWQSGRVACFAALPPWARVVLPCVGAMAAALVLLWAQRVDARRLPDYMEAFSLGNGRLPRRQGTLRSLSAVISLGTGACIGKEGALMQIAAVAASAVGRWLHVSPYRLRLMVGCGAAAGMTAAFHTPLAACLFVSEVVVGSLSIGYLVPLLIASCSAYALVWCLGEGGALFPCATEPLSAMQLGLVAAVAAVAAPLGKLWVAALNAARGLRGQGSVSFLCRMAAAGLGVGVVTLWQTAIVGNGQEAITLLLAQGFSIPEAAVLLGLKALLVVLMFGVGTMGGVLTPTLMLGAFLGWLGGALSGAEQASAFALVGMAAFLTASARTPVTALILVVELSLNASLIFPLMTAVAVAYALSRYLPGASLYDAAQTSRRVQLHVRDIMLRHPAQLRADAEESRLRRAALLHPNLPLPLVDGQGMYLGLLDAFAPDAAPVCPPPLHPDALLSEALVAFEHHPGCDYLPVAEQGRLLGLLSRAELYRTAALLFRRDLAQRR